MDEEGNIFHKIRSLYSQWGTQFLGRHDKLHAYVILSVLLCVSTADMIVDWVNYGDLSAGGFQYGLVTGPPQPLAIHVLLLFNIVGTFLYVVEMLNSLSIMTNKGHTRFSIELEQILVILFEEVPLAAANLGIVMCRSDFGSSHQMACGILGLLNTTLRLYVYGWLKEWRFRLEKTDLQSTVKAAVYVTASSIWLMLLATVCFTWRQEGLGRKAHSLSGKLGSNTDFDGVSVILLSYPTFPYKPDEKFENVAIHSVLEKQGDPDSAWLVEDINDIITRPRYDAYYPCHIRAPLSPPQCRHDVDTLKVTFKYSTKKNLKRRQPFGKIKFNVAAISGNGTECKMAAPFGMYDSGWGLYYVVRVRNQTEAWTGDDVGVRPNMFVSSPWTDSCRTAMLEYGRELKVC